MSLRKLLQLVSMSAGSALITGVVSLENDPKKNNEPKAKNEFATLPKYIHPINNRHRGFIHMIVGDIYDNKYD